MARHGSESYFVIGEGLLGESARRARAHARGRGRGGRAAVPLLPDGAERRRTSSSATRPRKKIGDAMAAGGGGASQIPAGFTYLGQFVDHDLTFDKTNVMLGENVSPAELLQARSPSLDLDSLYGAGPDGPRVGEVLRGRRPPPEDGQDRRGGRARRPRTGFDLPRGAGSTAKAKRKAIIPDPRNDENLAVAQTHLAMIRFHNRVVDTLPASVPPAQRFAKARELVTRHYQWMLRTDFLPRICAPGVVNNVFTNGRKAFEVGVDPDRRADDADRVLRRGVPARPLDDPAGVQLEQDLRRRVRHARLAVRRSPGTAATSAAASGCRATGSPTSGGSTTSARQAGPTSWCPRRSSTARCGSTRSSPTRSRSCPGFDSGARGEPRVPQPHAGEDGPARHRPADGDVPARARASRSTKLTKPQIRDGNNGANLDGLTQAQRATLFLQDTPLWFYILREAELNGGKLEGRRRAHRRRDVPPGDGGKPDLDRARPGVAPVARPERQHVPHGRPAAVRLPRGRRRCSPRSEAEQHAVDNRRPGRLVGDVFRAGGGLVPRPAEDFVDALA